jgi:hypothetical protein
MLRKGPCMLTLVLCALAHGSKTLAADAATPAILPPALPLASASTSWVDLKPVAPHAFLASTSFSARPDDFSPTEFRPRRHNPASPLRSDYGGGDPMFRTTTVWQRLNEFRAQDRVRLLTLWEMGGSNVSLQAGKKGDPSLQWTSSWTSQNRASHGLLDRVLAASVSGMLNRANASRYPASSVSATKQVIAVPANSNK